MAKKRTTKKTAAKARVELRMDADLYADVKQTADEAGISVNQLIGGLTRWAMDCVHVGSPQLAPDGFDTIEDPGHLWFGRDSEDVYLDEDGQVLLAEHPEIFLHLDFTEQRAIRERLDRKPSTKD